MCGYGLYRVASVYEHVGCAVMDWIEMTECTDKWDVLLWTVSSCLSVRTVGMCGYGL